MGALHAGPDAPGRASTASAACSLGAASTSRSVSARRLELPRPFRLADDTRTS